MIRRLINSLSTFIISSPSLDYGLLEGKKEVSDWFLEHLRRERDFYLVAGELSFALYRPRVVEVINETAENGKRVRIICGSNIIGERIEVNGETRMENALFSLADREYDEKKFNFKLYLIKEKYTPRFHFVISGNDILIEKPHLKSDTSRPFSVKGINSSVLMKTHLIWYFEYLREKSVHVRNTAVHRNALLTVEELRELDIDKIKREYNDEKYSAIYRSGLLTVPEEYKPSDR
jgi:hypothetical protein